MRYLTELYYLQDQRAFPFRKAVTATATVVAQGCDYFLHKDHCSLSLAIGQH